MIKVAVTGLGGVLGSYLVSDLARQFDLIDLYHHRPTESANIRAHTECNLLDKTSVIAALNQTQPDVIIHLAAITHIDRCQADQSQGEAGVVWQTNVKGTATLANWAAEQGKQLLFLSTESVFAGDQPSYSEQSPTNPRSWYGTTKAEAERRVIESSATASIIRAVIAYQTDNNPATFFGVFKQQFETGKPFKVVDDHYLTPTFIPDLGQVIAALVRQPQPGIFHATPAQVVTPFQFAQAIGRQFGYDLGLVQPTSLKEYLGEERAALRTQHACLDSQQTQTKLGLTFTSIDQALSQL